jgi:hypothetical protein
MPVLGDTRPPIERLLAMVEVAESGCWLFRGFVAPDGYARISVGTKVDAYRKVYAHRITWEHYRGPIPDGLQLDHLCRVRHCCAPDHLEVVSRSENLLRGNACVRSLVCLRGHWVLGENAGLYRRPSGLGRYCKTCHNERRRVRWAEALSSLNDGRVS